MNFTSLFNVNNSSFEEMWNQGIMEEPSEQEKKIFASMKPYRVPFAMSSRSDKRMANAYRSLHDLRALEASDDMEMIYTRKICRMCLMPVPLCRGVGYNLMAYEMDKEKANDPYARQLRKYIMLQQQAANEDT
ncbi:hypothetical protein AWZ03_007521 [Drosophila navojoa]|uniref:Uncharacterized protein n=1 Tax=Drosophila navojoa TaxID=7232 RepID=A0A484BCP5_DRONA|nr:hypothetical protein AWZ03_007521 [Drosophila navojoa]